MGKRVGMAEFKANCTRLLREVSESGEPITVTVRGKVIAVVSAPAEEKPRMQSAFGMLRSDRYRLDMDPSEPAADPADWDANNSAELYGRQ